MHIQKVVRALALVAAVLASLALTSCEHPAIFGTDSGIDGNRLVDLRITGGIAGIHQELWIEQGGEVGFRSLVPPAGVRIETLGQKEIADIENTFLNNNFFQLQDKYVTPSGADFFFYDITFFRNDVAKSVTTDYESAPAGLRAIVDRLNALVIALREGPLRLRMSADKDTLSRGAEVTLTLSIENQSDRDLELLFSNGQIYDFHALDQQDLRNLPAYDRRKLWSWSADRAFTAAAHTIVLQPQEKREYTERWDGRDASGTWLSGDVLLAGELVSLPGGLAELVRLHLQEPENSRGQSAGR